MRVLHVVDSLPIGGLERVLVALANGLQRHGSTQAVVCIGEPGTLADRLDDQVQRLALRAKPNAPTLPFRLWRVLRGFEPNIIHMVDYRSWPDATAAGMVYPSARRVRAFHGFTQDMPRRRRMLGVALARCTHACVGVDAGSAQRATEMFGIRRDRLHVLANGIDTHRFRPAQRTRCRTHADEPFHCITVASLTAVKNPQLIVDAAARLPENIRFTWVGDGPLRSAVQSRIDSLGLSDRISLIGAHDDVRPFLADTDAFVLPSHSEAMPLAVLEAMAMGLPVVATHVGALPELLLPNHAGRTVAPGDAGALADAIVLLRDRPDAAGLMGSRARKVVVSDYDTQAMVRRYHALFDALVKSPRRSRSVDPLAAEPAVSRMAYES